MQAGQLKQALDILTTTTESAWGMSSNTVTLEKDCLYAINNLLAVRVRLPNLALAKSHTVDLPPLCKLMKSFDAKAECLLAPDREGLSIKCGGMEAVLASVDQGVPFAEVDHWVEVKGEEFSSALALASEAANPLVGGAFGCVCWVGPCLWASSRYNVVKVAVGTECPTKPYFLFSPWMTSAIGKMTENGWALTGIASQEHRAGCTFVREDVAVTLIATQEVAKFPIEDLQRFCDIKDIPVFDVSEDVRDALLTAFKRQEAMQADARASERVTSISVGKGVITLSWKGSRRKIVETVDGVDSSIKPDTVLVCPAYLVKFLAHAMQVAVVSKILSVVVVGSNFWYMLKGQKECKGS